VENVLGATTPGRGKTAFFPPLYCTLVISTPCGFAEYDLTVANGVLGDGDGTHSISFFFTTDNLVVVLFLACSFMPAHASSGSSKAPEPKPSACTASEPFVDDSSDIQAVVS